MVEASLLPRRYRPHFIMLARRRYHDDFGRIAGVANVCVDFRMREPDMRFDAVEAGAVATDRTGDDSD